MLRLKYCIRLCRNALVRVLLHLMLRTRLVLIRLNWLMVPLSVVRVLCVLRGCCRRCRILLENDRMLTSMVANFTSCSVLRSLGALRAGSILTVCLLAIGRLLMIPVSRLGNSAGALLFIHSDVKFLELVVFVLRHWCRLASRVLKQCLGRFVCGMIPPHG